MKIALAIAPEKAQPSAFVVFRDRLEVCIAKAARLGYDAVELALSNASEVDRVNIRSVLDANGMELAAISTGRVYAEERVWFTSPDPTVRRRAVDLVKGLIDLAPQLRTRQVNIGRVRGFIGEGETRDTAQARFIDCMHECADHAVGTSVTMLLEPVNRYETNFVNSVPEALESLARLQRANVKVMPDVYHMNIEDVSITGSLRQAGSAVGYVHFADSNRRAPGQGHLDFPGILDTLRRIHYDDYVGVEILPYPNPDDAATMAVNYLRTLIPRS